MMEERISMMATLEIHTAEPFNRLFPIKESVLNEIVEDMRVRGYDYGHPIIIWAGHKVTVVDGHTRLAAALKLGMSKVPILLKDFTDEDAALQYAIRSQSHRRNLTAEELLNCLSELDKRKAIGRPEKTATNVAISGRSAKKTADLLGVSRGKVEKLRTINDHAPAQIREAVASGSMSIDKGYKQTMENRHREDGAVMNPPTGEELQKLKNSRLEAIKVSIAKMARTRLEREIQEYPEIRYSTEEREDLISRTLHEVAEAMSALPIENATQPTNS